MPKPSGVIQPGGSDTSGNCARLNYEVIPNYLLLLSTNGYVATNRMVELQPGSPVLITLEKDYLEVRLKITTTEDLSILVVQKP